MHLIPCLRERLIYLQPSPAAWLHADLMRVAQFLAAGVRRMRGIGLSEMDQPPHQPGWLEQR